MADCVYPEKEVFNPPAKTLTITEDGTYPVLGLEAVEVEVGGGSTPVIEPLSVTENGEYTAPEGVDGYSPVTVNTPAPVQALLLYHEQVEVPDTTSPDSVNAEEIQLPTEWNDDEHLFYFVSRYVGEVPNNHYVGSEIVGLHTVISSGDGFFFGGVITRKIDGQNSKANGLAGVFPQMVNGELFVRYKYSENATRSIGGTYDVQMYMIPKFWMDE